MEKRLMAVAETPTRPIAAPRATMATARRRSDQEIGRLLVMPALIFAIVVTQAPFLLTLWYSFQRWNLNRPNRRGFVGFDNYVYLLTRDPSFHDAIINTVVFVVGAVGASLALGLLYAELVNHRFPGRGIVRTLLITPFLIMPAAAALTWKNQMLNPNYGVLDWLINTLLPGNPAPDWLANLPMLSVVGVVVWRWAPFMMLILLAGMQSISEEVREAARVDGATGWEEFRDITLPHLWRFMQLGGLLGTVFIVQEIDPIFMMTQGGPGDATTTLPYLVYEKARESFDVGRGAALGVIMVLISIVVITLLLRVLDRMLDRREM
jgi:sorbitol/mannitol transport system permease protein